jgi:hypothetical protein
MKRSTYIIFLFLFHNIFSQNEVEMKKLTKETYYKILEENEGKYAAFMTRNPNSKKREYFIGFNYNKNIIFCNDSEEEILLFEDIDPLFSILNKKTIDELNSPLLKQRHIMFRLDSLKSYLINELFEKLNIQKKYPITDLNLALLDNRLKKYGYKKAYNKLYLHLIILCGEIINKNSNQEYFINFKMSHNFPLTFVPFYQDKHGNSMYYIINIELARMLNSFDIDDDYKIYEKEGNALVSILNCALGLNKVKNKLNVKTDKN